jgi:hypothetical protein
LRAAEKTYPHARCHHARHRHSAICTLTAHRRHAVLKTDFEFRGVLRTVDIYVVPPRGGSPVHK